LLRLQVASRARTRVWTGWLIPYCWSARQSPTAIPLSGAHLESRRAWT